MCYLFLLFSRSRPRLSPSEGDVAGSSADRGLLLTGSSADAASGAPIASASFFHLSRREEEE